MQMKNSNQLSTFALLSLERIPFSPLHSPAVSNPFVPGGNIYYHFLESLILLIFPVVSFQRKSLFNNNIKLAAVTNANSFS